MDNRKEWKLVWGRYKVSPSAIGFYRRPAAFGTNLWVRNNALSQPECLIRRKGWNSARRAARWSRAL